MGHRKRRRKRAGHDAAWKQFFTLSIMVEHLLRGFAGAVADLLDFPTLRDISGEWVQDGQRRRGDRVWRANYRDGSARSLVILLEFQSTVDPSMPRRILGNVGMAYEKLRRNRELDDDQRLRLICIVIHSGRRRWTAPGAADHVVVSKDGEVLSLLSLPYLSLDARRRAPQHLPRCNFIATLFELNGVATVAAVANSLRKLGHWLPGVDGAEAIRATYAEWLSTTMPQLFPRRKAQAMVERLTLGETEEKAMTALAERWERAEARWRRRVSEGRQEGRQEGIERGLAHERALLRQLAARKFGTATGDELARRLGEVTDANRLAEVGEWIIDCATGVELLDRL